MSDEIDDQEAVFQLLTAAQAVLFDFDGPVCDLFGGASTKSVADKVKRKARWYWRTLDREVEECDDSHGVLRQLRAMYDRADPKPRFRRPLTLAERIVARQERGALKTAVRTPDVVTLVNLLDELGLPLVVVSNNAEGPIRKYLAGPDLKDRFLDVCGRDPRDAGLMKPNPDCVQRAVRRLSLDPSACVLIGDQLTDLEAARSAGTPFLGFTQDRSRATEMTERGADAVVTSYGPVIASVEQLLKDREEALRPLSPAGR